MLGAGDADRNGQAQLGADTPSDGAGNGLGGAEQVLAAGYIGKSFVDRDALDQRRVVTKNVDRRVAQPLVVVEMAAGEDQLGAEFLGRPAGHAAMHTEGLGFVGGSQHHAAADGDRLAAQFRVQQLLDRGVEGIEIGVEDGGGRLHPGLLVAQTRT